MTQDDNDDDLKQPLIPWGELGPVLIAALFFIGFLWLMFGPSPFEGLVKQAKMSAPQPSESVINLQKRSKD